MPIKIVAILISVLFVWANAFQVSAQELVGTPLNAHRNFELGADLGFGHRFSPSLGNDFQDWGAQVVTKADGFPTRLGDKSIRIETREGFCGWDDIWSDCENGRGRHELSTSSDRDPSDIVLWYSISLYLPDGFESLPHVGTSLFQLWSGGRDSFQFKYRSFDGIFAQRKLDDTDTVLVPASDAHGRWIDVLMRVRNSMNDSGSLQMWVDGHNAYDYYGRTIAGTDPQAPNYFKFGIYNTALGADGAPVGSASHGNGEGLPNLHLFFDEVRFARSCDGLNLADLGYDCADYSYLGADTDAVKRLQTALNALGCDVGGVDGVIGRRTIQQAMTCRRFGADELPDTLSVSTMPTFAALYGQAAQRDMPYVAGIDIVDALSEIVGSNNDNALSINARVDDIDLDFILIGHFADDGRTDWLSVLFKDDLTDVQAEAAQICSDVTIQNWGEGSNHAELRFSQSAGGWNAAAATCLADNLPDATAEELTYLMQNFRSIAESVAANGFRGEADTGLSHFIESIAAGDVSLGGS